MTDGVAYGATAERPGTTTEARVTTYEAGVAKNRFDAVATEEPLEIRVVTRAGTQTVAVTMRTPGHDFELAAGFLYNEGLIASRADLRGIDYCVDRTVAADQRYNLVNVELASDVAVDFAPLERHFMTTSACGVCGKASIEQVRVSGREPLGDDGVRVDAATVVALPDRLRHAQRTFAATGGLHAAAAFTLDGELLALREDVGRHNALDKLVGSTLVGRPLPFERAIVMVSGRSSYELVQKSVMARVPIVCAVSAPSSLAIALAREFGVTLIGFLRGSRFNVYTHEERIVATR